MVDLLTVKNSAESRWLLTWILNLRILINGEYFSNYWLSESLNMICDTHKRILHGRIQMGWNGPLSPTCDERRLISIVTVFHTGVKTRLKCLSKQNLSKKYHLVKELCAFSLKDLDWPKWYSSNPDPNIPMACGSSVMSIFTNWPQPAGLMLSKALSIKKGILHTTGRPMIRCISEQYLIKIYHVVQELWAFSLTDYDRPDWCSAKPHHNETVLLSIQNKC